LFFAAGKVMAKYGPLTPFIAGTVMRFGGAACLGLLGWVSDAPVLLVAAAMQLLYQGAPFSRLRVPRTRRSRSKGARRRCHWLIHAYRKCSLTRQT